TSTQIVVVTLPDMQGYPIEQWGLTLLRGWQIGQKGKNNGVVLVVAPKEHQLRIETGYGAEGPLPDATADLIIRRIIVPRFKQGDYGGGIFAGVQAIEAALDGSFTADQTGSGPSVSANGIAVFGQQIPWMTILIVCIWIAIALTNILRVRGRGTRVYGGNRRYRDGGWGGPGGFGGGFGGGSSGGGFGGGGGSGGGGGASGRW
ncbi:MAG TPA: TPM domain-containing protein, partial [Sphingobium sp.]